jgi:hypothetical protein
MNARRNDGVGVGIIGKGSQGEGRKERRVGVRIPFGGW